MKIKNINIKNNTPKIVVVGSSSLDCVINTPKTPLPNETVMAIASENFYGGKGANQAVACSRLGAQVYFIGSVGMEPIGQQILRHLVDENINVGFVNESHCSESGRAYVIAAENQNTIVVDPAANNDLKTEHISVAEKIIEKADWILLQTETQIDIVEYTIHMAYQHNVRIGVYASPAKYLSEDILNKINFVVAKENDLPTIFGSKLSTEELLERYKGKLFLRDNENGTRFWKDNKVCVVKKEKEANQVFHTMGMGDAFTSGFTIALCHDNSIENSVEFGNEIAYHVSKQRGSQRGMPKLEDLK